MLFFNLILFLSMGALFYFTAPSLRKNPHSIIKNDSTLSKRRITPELMERYKIYLEKISKAVRLFGIFYIVYAFAQLFIRSNELSIAMYFIPWIPFIFYVFYARKIVTGKFNVIPATIIASVFVACFIPIGYAYMESSVIIDNEQIRITGMYGERIPIEQLNQVFLADTLPSITMRTNGISTGRINKGHFRSSSLQRNVKLLLHAHGGPYLYIIHSDGRHVIMNFRDRERTLEVYKQLRGLVRNE